MAEKQTPLFRKKAMEKMTSPDHLTEYLKVTNLGMWIVLAAAVVLLVGMLVWASVGTLETKAQATVIVNNNQAQIVTLEAASLQQGMTVTVGDQKFTILSVETDEMGRQIALADVELSDGTYNGTVVIDSTKPIDFLLERG